MSITGVVEHEPRSVPLPTRILVRLVALVARVLARRSPGQLRQAMERFARGARPAELRTTEAARNAVVAVSLACGGPQGCLPRSIATALLCRLRGQWPTWCVGVRNHPPFGAHAWVEVGAVAVGEAHPPGYHSVLISVRAGR